MNSTSSSASRRHSRPDFRSDHAGENPHKKLMRLSFWLRVQKLLGVRRFRAGPHLVLASREAGDVSVLLALDVPIQNIVAVEWKAHEAIRARTRFPGLEVINENVGDYIKRTDKKFACVFLDFCSWATLENLKHTAEATKHIMQPNSLIACNFQVGREMGHMRKVMAKSRRELEAELAGLEYRRRDLEDMDGYLSRSRAIREELEDRTPGVDLRLEARFFYSSRYNGSHGHPWAGQLFWVNPKKPPKKPECYHFSTNDDALRKTGLKLEKETGRAAALLNVPTTSVAAWKAHATRGTYRR